MFITQNTTEEEWKAFEKRVLKKVYKGLSEEGIQIQKSTDKPKNSEQEAE